MNKYLFLISLFLFFSVSSCKQDNKKAENYTFGDTQIVSDESLFPIVDDEHLVFQSRYKNAEIEMVYKPMQEALSLFLNDSIDVAVLPRELKAEEAAVFEKRQIRVRTVKFAIDGIAVITSKSNVIDQISVEELKSYLNGTGQNSPVVVFDNEQSSTVEYLMQQV